MDRVKQSFKGNQQGENEKSQITKKSLKKNKTKKIKKKTNRHNE